MCASAISFIGDLNSDRIKELKAQLNLVPRSDSVAPGGLLIDSGTTFDSNLVRRHLDAGKPVGLIAPNPATLTQLQALTGHGPGGPVEFLLMRPHDVGTPDTVVMLSPKAVTAHAGSSGEPPSMEIGIAHSTAGKLNPAPIAASFASSFGAAAAPGLVPPLGTYWGRVPLTYPYQNDWGYPAYDGKADDRVADTQVQPISGYLGFNIYSYWVNGAADSAYYVVLVHSSVSAGVGLAVADGDHNQGYFQTSVSTTTHCIERATGTSLTIAARSPSSSEPGQIVTSLQLPMLLWGNVGGEGPIDFTANYTGFANWPSWAMVDRSGSTFAQWCGYQSAVWNTLRYPADTLKWDDAKNILFRDGKVVRMPDQSKGSITFDAITAYVIEPPAFVMPDQPRHSEPPSCKLWIEGGLYQTGALIHTPDGCLRAHDGKPYYNWFTEFGGVQPFSYHLDLQQVTKQIR